jgi:hypothetical protein
MHRILAEPGESISFRKGLRRYHRGHFALPDPGTPGGSGVTVPNGNTASFIGSGGRIGIAPTPN